MCLAVSYFCVILLCLPSTWYVFGGAIASDEDGGSTAVMALAEWGCLVRCPELSCAVGLQKGPTDLSVVGYNCIISAADCMW